ncbi:catalase family peroxidase [Nitrosomonas halophila]|uniref:Catalase-related peroxidase n=1 Tax=Nitrosomonas halophila TaxID=44576 RepID=A0A1H3KYV3_9PROT|nr:catalase family peroxidase [Nitrosomonas halophila]SDY57343.1 catalase [Nitrosomonas halophila]
MFVQKQHLSGWMIAGFLLPATPFCLAAEQAVTAEQVVTAMERAFGVHPGERRNHIKGTCAAGEFVGLPSARDYTRSPLFSSKPLPVVARFSLPGGNPKIPDTARTPRGLALQIRLPDGSLQHMTMLNTPVFGAATPQTFLNAIVAKQPDPATGKPDPDKIKRFRANHPDSLPQTDFLASHNPPVSWSNSSYFGIHAFKFINDAHQSTLVRWRFVPQDGEKRLSDDEIDRLPPDFLEQKLIERVRLGPVRWDMILTIGQPGDPEDNPTLSWPEDRETLKIGTLTITSATPQKGAACEKINFDPLVMTDGIAPANDPILLFRSSAYAISSGKRLGGD